MGESQDRFWIFRRGSEAIYLVREASFEACRLWVHGPGAETSTYDFPDLIQCVRHQGELERKLVAEGFQFTRLGTMVHGSEHAKCLDDDARVAGSQSQ
jgi:hypothetical protein